MFELALYCLEHLETDWAMRKAAAYLRILLEEEEKRKPAP